MLRALVAALCLAPFVIVIVRGVRRENRIARDIELYAAAQAARARDRRESRIRN